MANITFNIGKQTTNLLSSSSVVVFSDISLDSKFNPMGASIPNSKPTLSDYTEDLAVELSAYVDDLDGISSLAGVDDLRVENRLFDDSSASTAICLLSSFHFTDDLKKHAQRVCASKFRVAKSINVKAVQQAVHNIFTWIPGERILNPEFGNTLYKLLYNGITSYNSELIVAEIRKCLSRYEPRVQLLEVRDVSTVDDTENNTVKMEIVYTIPALNKEQYTYTYLYNGING